jgi:ferredoxin-like protein FixX
LAWVLHPETANSILAASTPGAFIPSLNDPDVCLHCRRHQCIAVCPTAALATRGDGRLAIEAIRCVSCGSCQIACYEFDNIAWRPRVTGAG